MSVRPSSARSPDAYGTDFVQSNKAELLAIAKEKGRAKLEETERIELEAAANSPLLKPGYGRVPDYVTRRRKEESARLLDIEKDNAMSSSSSHWTSSDRFNFGMFTLKVLWCRRISIENRALASIWRVDIES